MPATAGLTPDGRFEVAVAGGATAQSTSPAGCSGLQGRRQAAAQGAQQAGEYHCYVAEQPVRVVVDLTDAEARSAAFVLLAQRVQRLAVFLACCVVLAFLLPGPANLRIATAAILVLVLLSVVTWATVSRVTQVLRAQGPIEFFFSGDEISCEPERWRLAVAGASISGCRRSEVGTCSSGGGAT